MRYVLILIVNFVIANIASSQINTHIEILKTNKIIDSERYFTGSFDFEPLPSPLQTTKVNFTLEAIKDDSSDKDWIIKIIYPDQAVSIVGDTLFYWPGPHKIGEKYTNSFEMIPIMSGVWTIALGRINDGSSPVFFPEQFERKGILFSYCINENGKLEFLGNFNDRKPYWRPIFTKYFTPDSVSINPTQQYGSTALIDFKVNIVPTPRIGDTSIVIIKLSDNNNIVNKNSFLQISSSSLKIADEPKLLENAINKYNEYEITFKILPLVMNSSSSISLKYIGDFDVTNKYSTPQFCCKMFFGNDGLLKYINDCNLSGSYDRHIITDDLSNISPEVKSEQIYNIYILK